MQEDIIDILLEYFPIMKAERHRKEILIDSNEPLLQTDCFIRLLSEHEDGDDETHTKMQHGMDHITVEVGNHCGLNLPFLLSAL